MEPWIKLYRKFTEWEWYHDINCKVVFLHLLLTANWKPKKWQGRLIDVGEIVTSRGILAEELELSVQQVRTALKKLAETEVIKVDTTNRFTVIHINNYDKYQENVKIQPTINQVVTVDNSVFGCDDCMENNQQITNKQPTDNQQITTTKELKNNRNIDIYINNNKGDEFRQVIIAYEQNIGIISPFVLDALKSLISSHDAALVMLALEEACKSNARNIRYIESIIHSWDGSGITSVESAKLKMAEHRQKHNQKRDKQSGNVAKSSFRNYPKDYVMSDSEKTRIQKMMEEYGEGENT